MTDSSINAAIARLAGYRDENNALAVPDYLHSADAVIELLEKGYCRAACLALLESHGKEVSWPPATTSK